jgi:hypothetical protein
MTMQFTRSQWEQIEEAEKARGDDARVTLLSEIERKLRGSQHPAIQAYREITNHYPRRNTFGVIIDTIGTEDIDLWCEIVRSWILHGWNPYNIAGMLDCFKRGGIRSVQEIAIDNAADDDNDELFEQLFGPPPEQVRTEIPEGMTPEEYHRRRTARVVDKTMARAGDEPWRGWHGGLRAHNGTPGHVLERVGWMVETHTNLQMLDGDRSGWIKALDLMYKSARGDWSVMERGIKAAWAREQRYRPTHPRGFVKEIQRSGGEQKVVNTWERLGFQYVR